MAANLANTSCPKNLAKAPAPCAKPGKTTGSNDAKYVTGLIATVSAIFSAPPPKNKAGFNKTFLPIFPNAGPTRGNTPPIMAPSAPKRNLFLKFSTTLSLPDRLLVSTYSPTSCEDKRGSSNISETMLYGPPAMKSPAPKLMAPVPAFLNTFDICTPSLGKPSKPYVCCANKLTLPPVCAAVNFLNLFINL